MTAKKRLVKTHRAALTPRSDMSPAAVSVEDSERLRQIRRLVQSNNRSTLDENLVICQIYMESRFDAHAAASGSSAKGLLQMTVDGVKQVYKYRKQKELGKMPGNEVTRQAFHQGEAVHNSLDIYDEATNIRLGTEYLQYWIDTSPSVEDAYKRYRGVANGIYLKKISACATKLRDDPDSMQILRDMVK